MIVRHWMHADPVVIASDTLVSEANRILSGNAQHALPVVDDGRLRGLVTRVNLLRMGHFVLSTQDSDELNFFAKRLRVRDVMVRRPATVQADETMQQCLLKGQALGVAQFPVLDGERVVGVISANEIFHLAAYCLGAWERRSSLTLAPVVPGPGVLGRITQIAEAAGAVLHGLYPIGPQQPDAAEGQAGRRLLLRLHAGSVGEIAAALEAAGFPVLEANVPPPAALAA
jgi:acetoin utilization protein AcuB